MTTFEACGRTAAVLGMKPGTARVRLHRSQHLVQTHLRPHHEAALTQEVPS